MNNDMGILDIGTDIVDINRFRNEENLFTFSSNSEKVNFEL